MITKRTPRCVVCQRLLSLEQKVYVRGLPVCAVGRCRKRLRGGQLVLALEAR